MGLVPKLLASAIPDLRLACRRPGLRAEVTMSRRWRVGWVLGLVAVLAMVGVAPWAVDSWWFETELGRARREMDARLHSSARRRLVRLAAQRPTSGEAQYRLG